MKNLLQIYLIAQEAYLSSSIAQWKIRDGQKGNAGSEGQSMHFWQSFCFYQVINKKIVWTRLPYYS